MSARNKKSVIIVGGGLAGSLLSIYLAKQGFTVDIFEKRPDERQTDLAGGLSINLALSTRGIHAIQEACSAEKILAGIIPMRGRMIHSHDGDLRFAPYGKNDSECINSVSRGGLNTILLNLADEYENVHLHFHEQCTGMDLESGEVTFKNVETGVTQQIRGTTVIATDGAGSAVRQAFLRIPRFNCSQSFLEHGYKELSMPPGDNENFLMEKHALHIWPRGRHMLIALPNSDRSFTCTLFLDHVGEQSFESLSTPERIKTFFTNQFPDTLSLMPTLVDDFMNNPTGMLGTIKCFPWHVKDKALLLGDSAHAIVPFYGQGMNCCFEDCWYLNQCINNHGDDWETVFAEFENIRKENTDAIADLAMDNFIEMRDASGNPKFLLKKTIEHTLEERFPESFISKYSMVTFHRIPYAEAMRKGRLQDKVIAEACKHADHINDVDLDELHGQIQQAITV